jgi:hypothetical protein
LGVGLPLTVPNEGYEDVKVIINTCFNYHVIPDYSTLGHLVDQRGPGLLCGER